VEEELACHENVNDSLDVDKSNKIHGDAVNNYQQNFVYLLSPGSGVVGPEEKN